MALENQTRDPDELTRQLKALGRSLGFQGVGVAGIELTEDEAHLTRWIELGRHGSMQYMHRHGSKRSRPAGLVPGTLRVISARMDYWPAREHDALAVLNNPQLGYIARYALGRDYHKVLRPRLNKLAQAIEAIAGPMGHRVFVDSGPVLEKALARNAGLGWIGKHTNLIDDKAGSWFVLGEIYTDLPLAIDRPSTNHCGSCSACIDACPTGAIVAPYQVDARRCISYLTIENKGAIPEALRPEIGNRIFGCDDCQLVCPWNKFAQATMEPDFDTRHNLDAPRLVELFAWTEAQWSERTAGSALRRPGYAGWLRNIAVALGNARPDPAILASLRARAYHSIALVREHVAWALTRLSR